VTKFPEEERYEAARQSCAWKFGRTPAARYGTWRRRSASHCDECSSGAPVFDQSLAGCVLHAAGAFSKIIPAFQKTPEGNGVTFKQSYGASGPQAAAVHNGLPADIVNLSLAPDVTVLSQAGLIKTTWNKDQYGGMVTDSIVVFVVRKGNPKNIKTWADLIKPGIQVINPNPFTSGGARWNVMAAWGAQIKQHKTPKQANAYLSALYKNITVQDSSARASMNTFVGGKGDVLLAYENEAIQAQQAGADISFVRPSSTILIENPIAVMKNTQNPTQAAAFVNFTRSAEAQDIWATYGYRPILKSVATKWRRRSRCRSSSSRSATSSRAAGPLRSPSSSIRTTDRQAGSEHLSTSGRRLKHL